MPCGDLRERITLQYASKASDGMGASNTLTWSDYATVWAKAWTVSNIEDVNNQKTGLTRIQKFKIRYRSVMKANWRIRWGVRYFNITAIDPDEKNEFIFLTCKEAV